MNAAECMQTVPMTDQYASQSSNVMTFVVNNGRNNEKKIFEQWDLP